jgi:hypothetical protein
MEQKTTKEGLMISISFISLFIPPLYDDYYFIQDHPLYQLHPFPLTKHDIFSNSDLLPMSPYTKEAKMRYIELNWFSERNIFNRALGNQKIRVERIF